MENDNHPKELTKLEKTRNNIIICQQKLARLDRRGVSKRDDEYKYWRDRLASWQLLETELLNLNQCPNHPTPPGDPQIGKTIMASGECHVKAVCPVCGANLKGNGQWITKKAFVDDILEDLPVFDDYRADSEPCAVCGTIGTELHHWAPKELFPETFEDWPKSYLCPKHHKQWHDTITTPFRRLRKGAGNGNGTT